MVWKILLLPSSGHPILKDHNLDHWEGKEYGGNKARKGGDMKELVWHR
jgi:NADH:ubiquinone oxidoreductase subunit C